MTKPCPAPNRPPACELQKGTGEAINFNTGRQDLKYGKATNSNPGGLPGLILYYFILLSPLALMALAAYPGIYTNDSFIQYHQMIEGRYVNDHPIIMALWWRCLWLIFGHPAALMFFHLGLFAAGLVVWARFFHLAGLKWARLMLAIVPWTAPFMIHLGFMWKDVGLTGCLFLAYALAAWLHAAP